MLRRHDRMVWACLLAMPLACKPKPEPAPKNDESLGFFAKTLEDGDASQKQTEASPASAKGPRWVNPPADKTAEANAKPNPDAKAEEAGRAPLRLPSQIDAIYLFADGFFDGNLGGRQGADKKCRSMLSGRSEQAAVRAVLSVDSFDRLDNLADRYRIPAEMRVVSLATGRQIAPSWEALLLTDTNPDANVVSLAAAGVLHDGEDRFQRMEGIFWSGDAGEANANLDSPQSVSCSGWKSRQGWGAIGGNHGVHRPDIPAQLSSAYPWFRYQILQPCSSQLYLLCVAFLPSQAVQ